MIVTSTDEVHSLRQSGQLAAKTLDYVGSFAKAGITTDELNQIAHDYILSHGAYPSPLKYKNYPKSICTSVNEVVCHGIPDDRRLMSGDIINIDITVYYKGFHGDTSRTFLVGEVDASVINLVNTTENCLNRAISIVSSKIRTGDIGYTIQTYAESRGYSVVREFCGHGIGREFHEYPNILHFGNPGTGIKLAEGMVFTIEPMLNMGKRDVLLLDDGWEVVTADGKPSAQFEHTILVTRHGAEVLTQIS